MKDQTSTDIFGLAVETYASSFFKSFKRIKVFSSIAGLEYIRPSYLFRSFNRMPDLEKLALEKSTGQILDVGACAGSHALALQNMNKKVTALEISEKCCKVMSSRGVKNVVCADIHAFEVGSFDTILLLMNGIGLAGDINNLLSFLKHLRKLLNPGGQIIFDSADIDYVYYERDGSKWVDLNNEYYGQVKYTMEYNGNKGNEFPWLFLDKNTARDHAGKVGFNMEILAEGDHNNYLAILKPESV